MKGATAPGKERSGPLPYWTSRSRWESETVGYPAIDNHGNKALIRRTRSSIYGDEGRAMFEWKSILVGALLPYIVVGVAIGIRQKSVKAGAQVAWAMAVMTVGMFSKNLKITSGPDN